MRRNHFLKIKNYMLIALIAVSNSWAQKPSQNSLLEILPDEQEESITTHNMRINQHSGVPIAVYKPNYIVNADTPEKMARQYLSENHDLLKLGAELNDLNYINTTETHSGYHVHFEQYKGEFPVYNSTINITIDRNNRVVFVMNGYKIQYGVKIIPDLEQINITTDAALIIAKNYLGLESSVAFEKSETKVYYNKGEFKLAQVVTIVPAEELFGEWEIMIDAQTGEIFRVEDKACYLDPGSNNPPLINGTGYVFDPDPITHARTTYGSPGFVDNNDADSDSLTAHREFRTLYDITFNGSVYTLIGPWAEIRDFESPFTGLHTNPTSDFLFTRSSDNFEAVNTYFHIDNTMRWINDSLGISLIPYQYTGGVRFDPHGLSGADNSHYITATGSIAFGDGGVDDAEDLGVVLHEFGHGLHDWVTVGGLSQVEGLSEGCGDYWATSYVRSTGYWNPPDPAYNWVFIWDGHNPFWPGRITNYTAHYPDGLVGQIHTDGQMWASSLMSIYDLIGRTPTDTDFIEALAMTNGSSSQPDAANAFITADQLIYGGSHLAQIIPVFVDRGYLEGPITADFMADVTNGPAPLTVQFTDLSISQPNPIISWQWDFDNDGTIDATMQHPTWVYPNFGIYTVTLTVSDGTNTDSETKTDYITVTDPNQVIDILFCDSFENGLGLWTITNNGGTCVWQQLTLSSNAYTLPATAAGNLLGADSDLCGSGTTLLSTATLTQSLSLVAPNPFVYQYAEISFDNDWRVIDGADEAHVEVSINGGSTWTSVWSKVGVDQRNSTEIINISAYIGQPDFRVRLRTVQPGWDWWWVVDNFCIYGMYIVPVELTSFTANAVMDGVELKWSTATESNNRGFEIERMSSNQEFIPIGYSEGHGTTTEHKDYSFIDSKLAAGNYTYRLKQIDFDGTFTYSSEVNVDVELLHEYALEQNYPNPFNPITTIKYSILNDGFVKLVVYNLLGEEVATLVNNTQKAGRYEVGFDGSELSSGVYIYRIETSNFTSSRKLILLR